MTQPITANLGSTVTRGLLSAVGAGVDLGGPGASRWTASPFVDPLDTASRWETDSTFVMVGAPLDVSGDSGTATAAAACDPPEREPTSSAWETASDPFGVLEIEGPTVECSTLGVGAVAPEDFAAEALARHERTFWRALAAEIWSGAVAQAAGLDNVYLAKAPALVVPVAVPIDVALGLLDAVLGQIVPDRRGVVHMPLGSLTMARAAGAVATSTNSDRVLTAAGNAVVADAGYSGVGPDGDGDAAVTLTAGSSTSWIYGTPRVQIRLGSPYLLSGGGTLAAATNDASAVYRQTVAYGWLGPTIAVRTIRSWDV